MPEPITLCEAHGKSGRHKSTHSLTFPREHAESRMTENQWQLYDGTDSLLMAEEKFTQAGQAAAQIAAWRGAQTRHPPSKARPGPTPAAALRYRG